MVLALALLLPQALAAPELTLGGGYVMARYVDDYAAARRPGFELSASLRWETALELELGGRWLRYGYSVAPPLDGFVAGKASPAIGPWRPAVGVELGVTGALYRDYDAIEAESRGQPGFSDMELRVIEAPVYAQVLAEPLRFRAGRFSASALGLAFGTTLPGAGKTTRIELTWLNVGVTL